ncbi:MAG: hypothetical protein V9G09_12185 [Candidatus Nanopelagicales bacterium]
MTTCSAFNRLLQHVLHELVSTHRGHVRIEGQHFHVVDTQRSDQVHPTVDLAQSGGSDVRAQDFQGIRIESDRDRAQTVGAGDFNAVSDQRLVAEMDTIEDTDRHH